MNQYSHVVFDLDNTLFDRQSSLEKTLFFLADALVKFGLLTEKKNQFIRDYLKLDNLGFHNKDVILPKIINLYHLKLSPNELQNLYYQFFSKSFSLYPTVNQLLEELMNLNINLGLITNGPASQNEKIKQLGLKKYFGKNILISSECGSAKPDVQIFKKMEDQLGIGKYLYVGDSYEFDVLGAINAGWDCAWIKQNNNHSIKKNDGLYFITDIAELRKVIQFPKVSV